MANDSTPILEAVNPGTDQATRLRWAASSSEKIAWELPLPPDLDDAQAMTLHTYANMAGATDTPTLTWEAFFGVGDTSPVEICSDSHSAGTANTAPSPRRENLGL